MWADLYPFFAYLVTFSEVLFILWERHQCEVFVLEGINYQYTDITVLHNFSRVSAFYFSSQASYCSDPGLPPQPHSLRVVWTFLLCSSLYLLHCYFLLSFRDAFLVLVFLVCLLMLNNNLLGHWKTKLCQNLQGQFSPDLRHCLSIAFHLVL